MKYWALLGTYFLAVSSLSQQSDTVLYDKEPMSIAQFFSQGKTFGGIRSFTMTTLNHQDLSDYYASAIGASLHYETARYKGFLLGINGVFIYRLFSNDLYQIDPVVGKFSSYERQLFDLEHSGNYSDLDRLEELYIDYEWKTLNVQLGKMEIHSPLVNLHDGRMKPKVFQGIQFNYTAKDHYYFHGSWLTKSSPRSTTHWYAISDAIGIYSNGCLPDGSDAIYHHHIESAGLGILGVEMENKRGWKGYLWEYYLDNIVNTTILKYNLHKDTGFYGGVMGMVQLPVGNGGSDDSEHLFYLPNTQTYAVSGMLGYTQIGYSGEIAGTWISNHGRFTFPREFGVDPFYTFISRSQLEGFGDALAWRITTGKTIKNWDLKLHWVGVKTSSEFALNKYGIPSYWQLNTDINWSPSIKLTGLSMRFLYVYRGAFSNEISAIQRFNKSDFHQFNFILNYTF